MHIVSTVLLWSLAFIFFYKPWKHVTNVWFGIIMIVAGFIGIYNGFEFMLSYNNACLNYLLGISGFISSSIAYPFFIWGLTHFRSYRVLPKRQRLLVSLVLALPIIIFGIVIPMNDFIKPFKESTEWLMVSWTVPYFLSADFFIYQSFLNETDLQKKKEKKFSCILAFPISLYIIFTNHILILLGVKNSWRYDYIAILIVLFIYLITIIRKVFSGRRLIVKWSFERNNVDSSMKAVVSGTSLLIHAIKNEIVKIDLCKQVLQTYTMDKPQLTDIVKILNSSCNHMNEMVKRIQEKTAQIIIHESEASLIEIIEESLVMNQLLLEKVKIIKKYSCDFQIRCDRTHIKETLNNIIKNAVEAKNKPESAIYFQLYQYKNYLMLGIQDNGVGIPKQDLSLVVEPFFTSKDFANNYGLGLTYCYQVMRKHSGEMEIRSKENVYTLVLLKFPLNKRTLKSKRIV